MILFFLNQNFERVMVVHDVTSVIWTERWSTPGDFEVVVPYSPKFDKIKLGYFAEQSESTCLMLIEQIVRSNSKENGDVLTIKGRSIDCILESIVPVVDNLTLTGSPEYVAADLLTRVRDYDKFRIVYGRDYDFGLFGGGLGSQTSEKITYMVTHEPVATQIRTLLDINISGIRVDKDHQGQHIVRIDRRGPNDKVVFHTGAGDFDSYTIASSIKAYRNKAIVQYKINDAPRLMLVSSPDTRSFESLNNEIKQRAIWVDATNINREDYSTQAEFLGAVKLEGLYQLNDHKYQSLFDGKLNYSQLRYKYGFDYRIGDVVKCSVGYSSYDALISEYVWSMNSTEISSYPILQFL